MPGKHFAVVLSEDEIAALADAAVRDLADRLAHRAFRPLALESSLPDEYAESDALAHLHALVHIRRAVARLEDQAARCATLAGAGYPQLGQATNISRQGARRRWPGLVRTDKSDHPQSADRRS
jgi:hypothetical protein